MPTDETDERTDERLEEAALVAALRAGDEQAYVQLLREQGGRMLAVARRFMRSDDLAQDAVQDAFLQAYRNMDRFQEGAKLSTWLHRITVNACLMKLRSARRRPEVSIEALLPAFQDDGHRTEPVGEWVETGPDVAETRELGEVVRQAIDRLPDGYRDVLLARDIEQLDTAEAAEALGLSLSATKTRLHRARQALRELLDPYMRATTP